MIVSGTKQVGFFGNLSKIRVSNRNFSEKAMTALARWRRMKEQEERGPIARRPHDVRECKSLADADRFRREVLSDISKKIASIQVRSFVSFFVLYRVFRIPAWASSKSATSTTTSTKCCA